MKEITLEEIRASIKKLAEAQKETNQHIKELKEDVLEIKKLLKEHASEANKRFQFDESEPCTKEDDLFADDGFPFSDPHEKLVDFLTLGNLIPIFSERGIKITSSCEREYGTRKGERYSYGPIGSSSTVIVVMGVRTSMDLEDVDYFLDEIKRYREIRKGLEDMEGMKLYGAMVYLEVTEEADKYAESKGLFIIKAAGSGARIVNEATFEAVNF